MSERRVTTDHDEIRRWAEQRGGKPARVRGTGGRHGTDDPGMIRLDFPGYSGEHSLEEIEWDTWFKAFDENELALLHETGERGGNPSRFNKIIGRDTAGRRERGEHGASRHKKAH
jgi:hypothetical protein